MARRWTVILDVHLWATHSVNEFSTNSTGFFLPIVFSFFGFLLFFFLHVPLPSLRYGAGYLSFSLLEIPMDSARASQNPIEFRF